MGGAAAGYLAGSRNSENNRYYDNDGWNRRGYGGGGWGGWGGDRGGYGSNWGAGPSRSSTSSSSGSSSGRHESTGFGTTSRR